MLERTQKEHKLDIGSSNELRNMDTNRGYLQKRQKRVSQAPNEQREGQWERERGREGAKEIERHRNRDRRIWQETPFILCQTPRKGKVHSILKVKTHRDNHKSQMSGNTSSKPKANSRDRKSAWSDETQMKS